MPRRQERVITKRTVDALSVEHRDAVFWDRDLPGFGIRVYPSGLKKYVVQSRGPGGSKRATLGRHGKLTAAEARRRAAEAIDRIKRGEDPIPPPPEPEPTMAVLAERYMRDYVPSHCRASSAEVYRRALDNHILPALGGMRVGAVGREQVMEAAGPQQDRDHRALRASRARHREGLGGQYRRQHRRRHPAGGWRGGGVMVKLNRRSISRRTVEALKVEKDTVFWDRDLPGFGIRVYASGTKMYVVQSRTKGKSVRVTAGRHGVISADEARRRAARIVNRIKAGEDPIPEPLPARLAGGPTVAGLAARYMEKHVTVRCKESTAEGIRGLLDKYILPEFGKLPLLAVERKRVAAFHVRLNGVPYHESLANLTPADVYFGRDHAIIERRRKIKNLTIKKRRLAHHNQTA